MMNWKELPTRHGTYYLDTILDFGKFNGKSIAWLIENQPNYLCWMYRDDVVSFDPDVIREFDRRYSCDIVQYAKDLEDLSEDIV